MQKNVIKNTKKLKTRVNEGVVFEQYKVVDNKI